VPALASQSAPPEIGAERKFHLRRRAAGSGQRSIQPFRPTALRNVDRVSADVRLYEAASDAIARARSLAVKSQDPEVRWRTAIAAARLYVAAKDHTRTASPKAAQKELNAIVAKSLELGYRGVELHARLALAEIEMKEGQTAAGRAHLAAIESDANVQGYHLVARLPAFAAEFPLEKPALTMRNRQQPAILNLSRRCDTSEMEIGLFPNPYRPGIGLRPRREPSAHFSHSTAATVLCSKPEAPQASLSTLPSLKRRPFKSDMREKAVINLSTR